MKKSNPAGNLKTKTSLLLLLLLLLQLDTTNSLPLDPGQGHN